MSIQPFDRLPFASDYMQGAHPAVLDALLQTNLEATMGYMEDPYCASAREKIRAACQCPQAAVHFFIGGTQTNLVSIGALLAPYQGVLAAETGHIAGHEAGAIEHAGHKVLSLPAVDGKITAEAVRICCETYRQDENRDHAVMPGMVYLSHPTERGTLYSLQEIEALRKVCDHYRLSLYLDGARLAYALATPENELSLADLAHLCDAFYIGGTKCGALFGEALVLPDPERLPHFFSIMKQNGAILAKGRLLGLQFDTLFSDELYLRIGRPAIVAADTLRRAFRMRGYTLPYETPTNQIFVSLEDTMKATLEKSVDFGFWEKKEDTHTVVRFATSWATTPKEVDALTALL